MSGALNRHRSVNKTGAKAPDSSSPLNKRKPTRLDPAQVEAFARFYTVYPRRQARKDAESAWLKINPDSELTERIMAGAERYANDVKDTERCYIALPATWLNGRRWEDEPASPEANHDPQWRERTFING